MVLLKKCNNYGMFISNNLRYRINKFLFDKSSLVFNQNLWAYHYLYFKFDLFKFNLSGCKQKD